LFENIRKAKFDAEYIRISSFVGTALILMGIVLICLAREVIAVLGTAQYTDSLYIVGFLVCANILLNLDTLRGFGFEIERKTYFITIISVSSRALGLAFLWFVSPLLGLPGVGIAFLIPPLVDYTIKVSYTRRKIGVSTYNRRELILTLLIMASVAVSFLDLGIVFRLCLILSAFATSLSARDLTRIRQYIFSIKARML